MIDLEVKYYLNPEVIILDKIVKILYTTQNINDIAKVVFDEEDYEMWLEDSWK